MANSEYGYDYSFKCIFAVQTLISVPSILQENESERMFSNCVVHFYPLFTCKADAFIQTHFSFFLKSFLTLK